MRRTVDILEKKINISSLFFVFVIFAMIQQFAYKKPDHMRRGYSHCSVCPENEKLAKNLATRTKDEKMPLYASGPNYKSDAVGMYSSTNYQGVGFNVFQAK